MIVTILIFLKMAFASPAAPVAPARFRLSLGTPMKSAGNRAEEPRAELASVQSRVLDEADLHVAVEAFDSVRD